MPQEVALNLALALVASSAAPVLLLDKNLGVVAASKSFCSAFEIESADADGRSFAELGAGEWNVPELTELLNSAARGLEEVESCELDLERNGQTTRRLVANAKKLHHAVDSDIRVVLTIADVTDVRIAEKLREDMVREKDVLLQELNHRVANSLQIVASILMQSARRVNSEETRSHLYNAHQRVMSIAALQQQLAGSKLGDVEVRPYLFALCDSMGASMIDDRQRLSLEVTADDGVATAEVSISLGLIVTELVINALKHAFPGNRKGKITVDYHSHGPAWTLSVSDNGVGIPADHSNIKSGLGTSIVQALARQLGAEVSMADAHPGTKTMIECAHIPALPGQATANGTM